jgi:hypothetical protein
MCLAICIKEARLKAEKNPLKQLQMAKENTSILSLISSKHIEDFNGYDMIFE